MTTELHRQLRAIGPFSPLQITPTADDHELLTDPAKASGPVGLLTYHGGRTITQASMRNLYIQMSIDGDFEEFTKAIVEHGYYVSPDGKDTANGTYLGAQMIDAGWSGTVRDSQIQAFLAQHFQPEPNTQSCLIFPPNLSVTFDDGSGSSCSAFCGYHSKTPSGIYYTVICDPSCQGCHGNFTPTQARQMVQAHEYGEWRSDPDGTGWYSDQTGMENGDECAWNLVRWGPDLQWAVQPLAVNGKQCSDVPAYQDSTPTPQPQPNSDALGPWFTAIGTWWGQEHDEARREEEGKAIIRELRQFFPHLLAAKVSVPGAPTPPAGGA